MNHFLPTIPPPPTEMTETKTTLPNSIDSLLDYDKHINTSYIPSTLQAIRDAMESNFVTDEVVKSPKAVPLENLFRFPPNTNSIYLPPEMKDSIELVNSYLPSPSGNSKNKLQHDFSSLIRNPEFMKSVESMKGDETTPFIIDLGVTERPNTKALSNTIFDEIPETPKNHFFESQSNYLPPKLMEPSSLMMNGYLPPVSGTQSTDDIPPQSHMMQSNEDNLPENYYLKPSGIGSDFINSQLPVMMMDQKPVMMEPKPSMMEQKPQILMNQKPQILMESKPPMMEQKPMMMFESPMSFGMSGPPPSEHEHSPHSHSWDYPDLMFDHHHHDHHPHHHHHEEHTTTTAAPPPPEEPRVKKYSYYYLGRKLWYVPLYFTLW